MQISRCYSNAACRKETLTRAEGAVRSVFYNTKKKKKKKKKKTKKKKKEKSDFRDAF